MALTLHYRPDMCDRCAVCGADLTRRASKWWLSNTWTADRNDFKAQEGGIPGSYMEPCGVPPNDLGKRQDAAGGLSA